MRRSAAPSQLNPAKRAKFAVPYKGSGELSPVPTKSVVPIELKIQDTNGSEISNAYEKTVPPSFQTSTTSSGTIPSSGTTSSKSTQSSGAKFRSPLTHISNKSLPDNHTSLPRTQDNNSNAPEQTKGKNYFSVVWCKLSKKKHKKWEGDAVLVTHGRSVTLYDMESKEIGKSSGYKSTELESLKEDETLCIGGKEIQVMSMISEEQFTSGTCFTGGGYTYSAPAVTVKLNTTAVKKAFVDPNKAGSVVATPRQDIPVQPRFDPAAPGALVMKRPCARHQFEYNRHKLAVVDVVVDPYLSSSLRPHQREGVLFLYECIMGLRDFGGNGAILADDMGLGKTLQCITLLWTLLKQGPYGGKAIVKRALIITPGSLVKNWFQEFKKWLGSERLKVFPVMADNRVEEYKKTAIYPVLLISYEMFVRSYDIIKDVNFDIVICDEGHRLKNTTIKTTSLIMSLPTRRRVILTGTPIQNDLKEFFSIVEFCNPGILGSSAAFHRVYEDPIVASRQPVATQEQITLGDERGGELSRLTKMFILRRTQEINNKYLPPKVELVLFCQPSGLQIQLYRQFLQCRLIRRCLSGCVDGAPHLICIAALKQLCNHPNLVYRKAAEAAEGGSYDEESVYSGLLAHFPEQVSECCVIREHSGKLVALSAILTSMRAANPRDKLVLVSNHTKTLNVLQVFCAAEGFQYVRLDGSTPTTARQDIVNKFNNKHSQETVFLLSSKAGGVGLNLVGASRLVLYDIDWNPANDLQAMARVWRDGQTRKVYIYRLLTTGTIEEKVYQRQISKQGLSGAVMDLRDKKEVQFSLDDLKDLFTLNERTVCDTHALLDCDCDGKGKQLTSPGDAGVETRPCQLGASSAHTKSKRNLSMDELLDWHHVEGRKAEFDPEWHISGLEDVVSFVFWNETKANTAL